MPEGFHRQGPSATSKEEIGFVSCDTVLGYPCKSWPQSTKAWFDHQETNTWPTADVKKYAKTTKCFVVGVGNKASENADFEWRVSTSLAERYLMFNLNITQIRCNILMKMITKTYINFENDNYISSFMCKTVLFHCITSKPSNIWKECNILNCLDYCLFTLNRCILGGNCPHFTVRGNNLMAGKFSAEIKHQLLDRMSNLIPCSGIVLSGIRIDDLGERLQIKLNMIHEIHHDILLPGEYTTTVSAYLFLVTAGTIVSASNKLMHRHASLELKLKALKHLTRYYRDGDILEKTACRFLAPLLCTSIGSLMASCNIQLNNQVSLQALALLEAGLDSDVSSSRLKFATIMYCTGDMERAASVLKEIEEKYIIEITEPVCSCFNLPINYLKRGFCQVSSQYNEAAVKYIVAFCVRFFPSEINCVPNELKLEMFRSTQEDLQYRDIVDFWMDCAVLDSLPYLYFLQYKTYGNLQRTEEQKQALNKLVWVIRTEENLAHRETALNVLGQCMEYENRPVDALKCYMLSLRLRERNNAAKIHICRCLVNVNSRRLAN